MVNVKCELEREDEVPGAGSRGHGGDGTRGVVRRRTARAAPRPFPGQRGRQGRSPGGSTLRSVAADDRDETGETDVVARPPMTVYRVVGGMEFFDELVERFYKRVATDILLRPLYPDDLGASKRHLALFLAQYWGGPTTYSDERGHPRLRLRHMPFAIGEAERDRWLHHMRAAVVAVDPPEPVRQALLDYFTRAADAMRNTA